MTYQNILPGTSTTTRYKNVQEFTCEKCGKNCGSIGKFYFRHKVWDTWLWFQIYSIKYVRKIPVLNIFPDLVNVFWLKGISTHFSCILQTNSGKLSSSFFLTV